MINLPSLKQLRYLVTLSETKHFGKAAEACFVTQSTLSAGIQELETQLDAALVDRTRRELTDEEVQKIADTYHAWRGDATNSLLPRAGGEGGRRPDEGAAAYADVAGFCKSATTAEIAGHGHVLTPGRYVGAEEVEDDGEPFDQKMQRLVAELHTQFAESAKLEQAIKSNLRGLGYGG